MTFDHDEHGVLFCSGITIEGFKEINASTLQRIGSVVSKARIVAGLWEHEMNRDRPAG